MVLVVAAVELAVQLELVLQELHCFVGLLVMAVVAVFAAATLVVALAVVVVVVVVMVV
jgi:hypothetical protein